MNALTVTVSMKEGAAGVSSLVQRASGLDPQALVRARSLREGVLEVFVSTPFEVVASRRCAGSVDPDGGVVGASDFLAGGAGTSRQASWPGSLPPASGFTLVDQVPVDVVRGLADQGHALARQFNGPLGPPKSLLDQTVLTVEGEGRAEIPMRMIFACTSLGLIPGFDAPLEIPRHLRVSTCGRWVRLDAPFGTVYRSSGLSLLV
ncbi:MULTISPECIES: hypothetical protein [Bacteria]|uniref:hypothetical protein n=1 Tax=Bacteria TaxID=2 RepID=UPI0025C06E3A|nr:MULTISPECIES: hypothetical protein [Bacteria]